MINRHTGLTRLVTALSVCVLITASLHAGEWPGFLGPNRDGLSTETGLLKEWPEAGPELLWKVDTIGEGWSSMAVVDGLIYTTGNEGDSQMLICLGMDGKEKWRVKQGPKCDHRKYGGARSTPTVDGDRIYVTGGGGSVTCHAIADGLLLWNRNMRSDMGGKVGGWKYAESVLILDDLAVVTPGGSNAIVALNKMNGEEVWKADVSATAGYSSCTTITENGQTLIVNGSQSGLLIVDAKTGFLVHKHDFAAPNTANLPTPIYVDGLLFWAVGYGKGSLCLKVTHDAGRWSFTEAWTSKDLNCHPGNYVIAKGLIYGKGKRGLACLDLKTGETKWMERTGAGQAMWADGMVYTYADSDGRISLVDPNGGDSKVKGSFKVEGTGRSWSHPVIIGGRLLLRYDTNLYCFNIKAQ